MPVHFHESFSFDQGILGRNLDTMDEKVRRFIKTDLDIAAGRCEAQMKTDAPWRDRTTDARNGLWSEAINQEDRFQLYAGHGVEYGIYLEKSNGGRFQVVMPTLIATAVAFMQSLTEMLHELDNPAPVLGAIEPGVRAQRGTSQGAGEHAEHVKGATEKTAHKARIYFRGEGGRFAAYKNVHLGTGHKNVTKKTKKTTKTKRTKRA
jgi:hypothetical protein